MLLHYANSTKCFLIHYLLFSKWVLTFCTKSFYKLPDGKFLKTVQKYSLGAYFHITSFVEIPITDKKIFDKANIKRKTQQNSFFSNQYGLILM